MIVFENDGEIDSRSIYTFGISVKEGDNPIGFFGTGLKYAIAVLLRTGHKIKIFSGEEEIEFSLRRDNVRGKEFEFVCMSCDRAAPFEIGFTTELGKTWDLWMSYRELACNMRDEKGEVFFEDPRFPEDAPKAEIGKTKVMVSGQEFEKIFAMRHQYLLDEEPDMVIGRMQILKKPSESFYYRDVRVMGFQKKSMYTYNDVFQHDLTEDRTIKHQYMVPYRIATEVLECHDEELIRNVLTAKQDFFEFDLDFEGWAGTKPSAEFIKVVADCIADRVTRLNPTAIAVCDKITKKVEPKEIQLTAVQQAQLEKALDFCEKIGFMIRGSYPIKVIESLGEGCLGMAADQTIYIAERAFHLGGTKQVASTLIEEYLHLRQGWKDLTRELQSFLFDKVVSLGEELIGEPL